jgi:hypothetical protein
VRGCLSFLLFAALLIGAVAWVGLPTLAAGVIDVALTGSGFHGEDTTVDVRADPPLELLAGHADRIAIESRAVTSGSLAADTLTLTLDDVTLADRSAGASSGTLTGVTLAEASGAVVHVARIDLGGPSDGADARLRVTAAEVRARAQAALGASGIAVTDVTPDPPDSLVVTALGQQLRATLVIDPAGAIALSVPGFAPVALVAPPPGVAIRFRSVTVASDRSLLVEATIDLGTLLGG